MCNVMWSRGLSQQEVEKLKVVYGMVIQHMKETEDDEDGLDNSITPLIDTRSVRYRHGRRWTDACNRYKGIFCE